MRATKVVTCANGVFVGNKSKFSCVTLDRRVEKPSGKRQGKELPLPLEGLMLRTFTCNETAGACSLSV